MKDLFGNEIENQPDPKTGKSEAFPKENPMIYAFGTYWDPEMKCKDCELLWKKQLAHTYYKCSLRRDTGGKATDHKKHWPACAKFKLLIL